MLEKEFMESTKSLTMTNSILNIINESILHIEKKDYKSFDIFDALTCKWIEKITAKSDLARRIAIQINAKSPIDLHWLGMQKMQHTKTISDMLWLNCLLFDHGLSSERKIESLFNLILKKRTNQKYVWGLNFPYTTRFINAEKTMPNLYNTCTSGIAISYYCEKTNKKKEILKDLYFDLCSTFTYINEGNKGFYIYYPGQKHPTYNVNALALFLFTRINAVSKEEIIPEKKINEILELLIDEQLENGGWLYSRSSNGKWIDGFHTGFIIESLIHTYLNGNKSVRLKESIDKAIYFYVCNMFTKEGEPKYFNYSNKYPIESQNYAQAIQTISSISIFGNYEIDSLQNRLVSNTIKYLYSGNGYFYYKKESYYTIKSSYLRWSTSPMLLALMHYYNTQINKS